MKLPSGFFSPGDICAYRKLYWHVPAYGKTVEIGAWRGRSICAVAEQIKRRKLSVAVVEPFFGCESGRMSNDHTEVYIAKDKLHTELHANLKAFGLESVVHYARKSIIAALEFFDHSLDLVFIDGDHSYDAVRTDIRTWLPKLKSNGVLCGHDYTKEKNSQLYEEVKRAVHDEVDAIKCPYHPMCKIWMYTV